MEWFQMSADAVLDELKSSRQGISREEAGRRIKEQG